MTVIVPPYTGVPAAVVCTWDVVTDVVTDVDGGVEVDVGADVEVGAEVDVGAEVEVGAEVDVVDVFEHAPDTKAATNNRLSPM
jgi:hypothetical protein